MTSENDELKEPAIEPIECEQNSIYVGQGDFLGVSDDWECPNFFD